MTHNSANLVSRIRSEFTTHIHAWNAGVKTVSTNTPTSSTRTNAGSPVIADSTLESLKEASDNAVKSRENTLSLFDFANTETAKIVTRGAGSFDPRIVEFVRVALEQRSRWGTSKKAHLPTWICAVFPVAPTGPDEKDLTRPLTRADLQPVTYARWDHISDVIDHTLNLMGLEKANSASPKAGQIRVTAVSSPTSAKGAGNSFQLQVTGNPRK